MTLGGLFDLEEKETQIQENEELMLDPDFWNDSDKAAEVIANNNYLKKIVDGFNSLSSSLDDIETSHELLREEYDEELAELLEESVKETSAAIEEYELNLLLSGEHDSLDALLELHPGAGGTESQDWAEMLLRMYQRYSERSEERRVGTEKQSCSSKEN